MDKMLGSCIQALRNAKGFTTEQAAGRMGISRQQYERIEGGSCRITLDILSKAAETFDADVGDITDVLDAAPAAVHGAGNGSSGKISDMLDLFYANKHMREKLQREPLQEDEEREL